MIRVLAAVFLLAGTSAFAADPPASVDARTLDKSIVGTLREVHDRGADLYNISKDYAAAYRLYEGSLLTVKPILSHHPQAQKIIDDGLAKAALEPDYASKAFALHEAIEKVRAELKGVAPMPKVPTPKPPIEPKPKNPAPKPNPEPTPKTKETKAKDTATISGKVSVAGKALAEGTVTFVSLDQKAPKVVNAAVKDGTYTIKDLPAGKYAVAITSKMAGAVPAKFATTDTSSLTYQAKAGASQYDIGLK